MTIALMPATEFIGVIEMEMVRVVKPFMFKSHYRWFREQSRFVKDSVSSLRKETLLSHSDGIVSRKVEKTFYLILKYTTSICRVI